MRINQSKKDKHQLSTVHYVQVDPEYSGQRIDNFLIRHLKTLPKSRIYRLLRKGEVRVNKKRIDASYRLIEGDRIRIPPLYLAEQAKKVPPAQSTIQKLAERILYEDDELLVINKPSGMSVHAGQSVRIGIIEALRHLYTKHPHLELAHRLDSETSGCLVIAKKRRVLREIHALLREGKVKKTYLALTKGAWKQKITRVDLPLRKIYREKGHTVLVQQDGKSALTEFHVLKQFNTAALLEVHLFTGRTHQIRVHAQAQGHPIAGDERYGDKNFNQVLNGLGLKRLFLHASQIEFELQTGGRHIKVSAPLEVDLTSVLNNLGTDLHEK